MGTRIRAVVLSLVAIVAALTMAGCALKGGSTSLDGTSWRLTGWTLSSLDPNAFTITAAFADGKISGTSAVNSYGGSYSAGPSGAFSVSEVASTLMAGDEPAMRAEGAYMTLLSQAEKYGLKDGALTLYDANGNESLIFKAAPK
jgi:heat shock protein HslJ